MTVISRLNDIQNIIPDGNNVKRENTAGFYFQRSLRFKLYIPIRVYICIIIIIIPGTVGQGDYVRGLRLGYWLFQYNSVPIIHCKYYTDKKNIYLM